MFWQFFGISIQIEPIFKPKTPHLLEREGSVLSGGIGFGGVGYVICPIQLGVDIIKGLMLYAEDENSKTNLMLAIHESIQTPKTSAEETDSY